LICKSDGGKTTHSYVDDEPQITRVLRRSLTTHGYDVRSAADGESALETLTDWPPDLVVTDLSMPNMNGLELCKRLRTISKIPIIVLSVRVRNRQRSRRWMPGRMTM
jgi:two-component system KDP operon response regulator KdpE